MLDQPRFLFNDCPEIGIGAQLRPFDIHHVLRVAQNRLLLESYAFIVQHTDGHLLDKWKVNES